MAKANQPNQPQNLTDAGESLADFQKRKAQDAWVASGSQEDPGSEFQKATSKQGRESVAMPEPSSPDPASQAAGFHPTALRIEPPTLKSIVGHSEEKKKLLAKMKKSPKKGG